MPRDRDGSFEPQIIPKRTKDVSAIENKVLAMCARDMSQRPSHPRLKTSMVFKCLTI